jgi:hypothetical protein
MFEALSETSSGGDILLLSFSLSIKTSTEKEEQKSFLEKLSSDIVSQFIATEEFKFEKTVPEQTRTIQRVPCGYPGYKAIIWDCSLNPRRQYFVWCVMKNLSMSNRHKRIIRSPSFSLDASSRFQSINPSLRTLRWQV